jgi:hypothetical protein
MLVGVLHASVVDLHKSSLPYLFQGALIVPQFVGTASLKA